MRTNGQATGHPRRRHSPPPQLRQAGDGNLDAIFQVDFKKRPLDAA